MNIGKRVVQLWSQNNGHWYQVHLAAPQTRDHAEQHIRQLAPHVRKNMHIWELDVVDDVSAEAALSKRDTDRCPPMSEEEFDRRVRDEQPTLDEVGE